MSSSEHDNVLDDVLNLEEQYFQEGYGLGVADGSKSGRIEGRTFGLEKGFGKFMEMGRLHGKALAWEARLPKTASHEDSQHTAPGILQVLSLNNSERLRKHISRLAALTEPAVLSTENSEAAVSDFEDKLKDGKAKATLIAKIVGEDENTLTVKPGSSDKSSAKVLRIKRNERSSESKPTGEMEDFTGLPAPRG